MVYAIRLPDGSLVQNIPDEVTPEEAKKRIVAAGLFKPPVPETTIAGQAKELVKGLVPGAVGLVEQAAIGASALLPEAYEKPTREAIARVAGAAKAPFAAAPGYEESVGRKLSEAIGSTAPFLLAGPFGLAGRAAAVGLGVGAGAGEARTRAEKEGATEEQRGTATALGVIPGAMEAFAPFRILSRVPEAATAQGVQLVKRALLAGGEEAAQEAASGFAQNLIAKGVYKPEQELIEGLGEQAAYGGATGAIVQGLMDLALGRRARGAAAPPPGAPAEAPIERAAREAQAAAPAAAPAAAEIPPLPDTYAELVLYGEQLKQLPKSKERDAALKAAREKREAIIAEEVKQNRLTAEKAKEFMTAEEAAAAEIQRRDELETEAPAEAPPPAETIPEPEVVKKGEPPPTSLQSEDLTTLGLKKKQPLYKRLLGKDMEDPAQRDAALADIENYLVKGHGSEESRASLTAFKERFAPVAEPTPTETPSVPTAAPVEQPSGASPAVAGEPVAGAAPGGAGITEPTGVVPTVADVTEPAGREGQQPAAVEPIPAPAPTKTTEAPTFTEAEIEDALAANLITPEQAERAREELRTEEAPPTTTTAALQKQIDDIKAQMDALRQKNGRPPAKKSPARAKFDALQEQLNTLQPAEEGDLAERLKNMEASGVVGSIGTRPTIDIDAVRENLTKARAAPRMYEAMLNYIGVDKDGNYLPTTYSSDEAAELAGLKRSSGANVRRAAEAMGVTADVISRFHAGQRGDIVGIAKNVSESGTGAPVENVKPGLLYTPPTKKKPAKAVGFLRPALTEDGKLDFSTLTNRQVAEMYARASNFDPKRENNIEVINQLNGEIDARTKKDKKGMQQALDSAYRVVRIEEEETAAEETETSELPKETGAEDTTRRLSDEGVQYRSIPQTPVITNRATDAELEKVVSDIEKALGGKIEVTILDDVTDVDAKQKPGSRAGALSKGGIYLFRSGIAKGIEGQKTIFHELFHKGLKNLLPEAEYRAAMNRFYSQSAEIRAMADAYLASDVGKQDTKNLSPQDARTLAVEESLAKVAEQTDLKPTMVRQIGNFLARVADRLGMPQLARAIRTMGLNEQQKFIQDALRAGMGPSKVEEGAPRFRAGEGEAIKPIGRFGPIKNASIFYWSDETGVALQLFDQDLIDSGVKPSRAVVDQFDLDISKDGKTAEIHTHGVPPGSSAVLSKYKDQISRVKPVGFSGDPYYKFDPGAFNNKEIRQLIRSLRDIAVQEGSFDKVETVKIKRATGATAGRAPREISREAAMRFRTISPQAEATAEELDVIGEKKPDRFRDKVGRELRGNVALRLREKFVSSMAPMEDWFTKAYGGQIRTASGRLNPIVQLSRALDSGRVSKAAQVEGGLAHKEGLIVASELKNTKGESVSYLKVLKRIADTAKAEGKTYENYRNTIDNILYGHREYGLREKNNQIEQQAQALEAAGKKDEAKALRENKVKLLLNDGQIDRAEAAFQRDKFIKGVLADLDTIRFNMLDMLVDTGRITAEQAQDYKDAIGYIPFNRIGEYEEAWTNATRGANRGAAALKRMRAFEGSDRKSTSVIENFSGLMDWGTREAMKNEAARRALEDMELMGAAQRRDNKPASDSPGAIVTVYRDGTPTKYYVPDPAHIATFSMADPQLSNFWKGLSQATRVLRAGVTSMPPFAVKQVFDDIVRAYTYAGVKNNGELVRNVLTNFPKHWVDEVFKRKTDSVRELEQLGIVGTFDFTQHTNLKDILRESGAEKEGLGHSILRVMEAGAKASDLAVREAIYRQVLKETKSEQFPEGDTAKAESAAREIINFSRRGSSNAMNIAISIIPFFNAYAQGMDKLATAAAGKVVGQTTGTARSMFYKRMGVLTAMGLAYALMMQDDEDYQALPDHVRDTNWIIPGAKINGQLVGIPVPAELAFFFKAIPERVLRYYKYQGTEEEQAAIEVLGNLVKRGIDVFSTPNLMAQGVRPLVENMVNYSFFLGRPLESQAQLELRPAERYGTGTSDAMKAVAQHLEDAANATGIEAFAISPIKLENALRGIFGTSAGIALSLADMYINPDRTDRPLHQQLGAQLTGASAVLKSAVGTRYMDEIYNLEKRTTQVYNSYNRLLETAPEKADKFLEDNIGMYSIRDAVQGVMESIRSLNDTAKLIDRDTSMSPEERRKAIDELRAEQNDIARQVYILRKQAMNIQLGL